MVSLSNERRSISLSPDGDISSCTLSKISTLYDQVLDKEATMLNLNQTTRRLKNNIHEEMMSSELYNIQMDDFADDVKLLADEITNIKIDILELYKERTKQEDNI